MAAKTAAPAPSRGSKLTLGFGLVNVPIAFKPLAETERPVPGKMACPEHGPHLTQGYTCCVGTEHEHPISNSETVRVFPHPDHGDTYVQVDPSVIEEFAEARTGAAQIERVVDAFSIDPAYIDRTHLVWPQAGGEAAFDLLTAVLRREGKAAVATTVLNKQTRMIVFRWSDEFGCLLAHVLRFSSRLRHGEAELVKAGAASRSAPADEMVEAAARLFASLEGEFDASEVEDEYTPLMQSAIRAAAEGRSFEPAEKATAPVASADDLMAALTASVAAAKPKAAKKPSPRKKVAA